MRQLTKSIGSFSWALSLFGARQMANVMNPKRAEEAFDSVTAAAEGELGDFLRSAFQMGDRMQRGLVDMTLGMLSAASLDPAALGRTMGDLTSTAARLVPRMPGHRPEGAAAETGWGPMPSDSGGSATRPSASDGGWGPMGP
jgi:hypothetical protein